MSALDPVILAKVTALPSQFSPTPAFVASPAVPSGLTLLTSFTASAAGLNYTSYGDWIYVVVVGGGGSGNSGTTSAGAGGGGGGACVQGWIPSSTLTAVTVGAGGASVTNLQAGNDGGTSVAGALRAPGGAGAGRVALPGAGSSYDVGLVQSLPAYGIFIGGQAGSGSLGHGAGTSGGGGFGGSNRNGGEGVAGPGGGGSFNALAAGGNSRHPNTATTWTGGAGALGVGGGGAGILANGGDAVASTSAGAGGSGGGGGGGTNNTTYPSGAGGVGCVLIYVRS